MPLPMVHIQLAYLLDGKPEGSDLGSYLLGAISPDGIHMQNGASREDKRKVHLVEANDSLLLRLRRIDTFYQTYFPWQDPQFVRGWTTHLAADCLWSHYFMHGYWDKYELALAPSDRTELYYEETNRIDFLFYRTAAWRNEAWDALRRVQPNSFPPFLSASEIAAWRDNLLIWFTELKKEPAGPPKYFTAGRIGAFLEIARETCQRGFRGCFADTQPWLEKNYLQNCLERVV